MAHPLGLPFDEPGEPVESLLAPPAAVVYTVSALTQELRDLVGSTWPDVRVEGEVSNLKVSGQGHCYFTLKDEGAQLRAVLFKGNARNLKFRLEDGQHVVAQGRLSVYEARGEYQIICDGIEPKGLGALQLALEQLKRRLQVEGLLDAGRKRPLPVLPRRIGVVTSLSGAALRDVLKVLGRRAPNAHVVIAPTRVQGDGAALEIARALGAIGRVEGVDVVIVGRGGGSIEDLWAFNEEPVARAIARCPVPVISAIGHEVDVTLADLVADHRAPTPSAAAEIVVAARDEFVSRIVRLQQRARAAAVQRVARSRFGLQRLDARPAYAGFRGRLAMRSVHVTELTAGLAHGVRNLLLGRERACRALRGRLDGLDLRQRMARLQSRLARADGAVRAAATTRVHAADVRMRSAASRLDSLSPLAVLGRGYALCWSADGRTLVRAAADVQDGDEVRVTLRRGALTCTVRERSMGDDPLR